MAHAAAMELESVADFVAGLEADIQKPGRNLSAHPLIARPDRRSDGSDLPSNL